ncbi:head morphogenesis protein [Cereibacter changlensis JA139]|uniref:Head morphogenesis protein n=2 Tax=Cereibacter changlensis TaxID=402884 RepID=A0A2T4JQN7_9RHOB|nr:phage minor head protein [Cereibacter changlensis]PTE20234.1 head morphogenesis protein [Cereibacter changlensis JA139]PZX47766.1 phage Mu protein F like protein [Cereibacter changlensis]
MADPAGNADRPGYSFNPGPPPEASRYLANKGLRPAFSFRDVEPEEHAVAFTVAKAMQLDVLTGIREEVQRALDEGLPLATFQKNLRPRLEAMGWWGKQAMVDPASGKTRRVQLGSPRRLRTIYEANIRSARAAGQWERIKRTKRALPYLLYQLGPSIDHRDEHLMKAGLILPVDHPFWATWFPPNGWGCKCWVRQITRHEAEDLGVDKDAPPTPMRAVKNRRTGATRQIPLGIDPGWDRNPGALRLDAMEQLLNDKLEAADPAIARAALRDIATSWRAERVLKGEAPGAVPVAMLPGEVAQAVGMAKRVVSMTSEYGRKFVSRQRGVTTETLLILGEALETGELLLERGAGAPQLHVISRGETPWLFVLKLMQDAGEIWVNSFYPLRASKRRSLQENPLITTVRE